MAQLLRRRAVQNPGSIGAATDPVLSGQRADRAGHRRTMRTDEIRQPLVRERQRHGDALGQNSSPALRQVPEREQQSIVDSLMVGDRERHRERVRAARPAIEELQPELRPWVHPHDQAMIEYGEPRRFQHDPANLRLHVGALLIPAPRPDDVAGAEQFHAPTSQHFDLATDQPVDDQEASMMGVGLLCRGDVPIARRQVPHARSGLAPSPFTIAGWDQILKLGISIDDADRIRGSAQAVRSRPRSGSACSFGEQLTRRPSISSAASVAEQADQRTDQRVRVDAVVRGGEPFGLGWAGEGEHEFLAAGV
jgi:hypothetical protein